MDQTPDALGLLNAALERARAEGTPKVVTIAGGAAGARAAEDFLGNRDGAIVVRGGFSPLTRALGLGPLPEIAAALIGGAEQSLDPFLEGQPRWMRAALEDVLGRTDDPRELAEIYAAAAHLLDHALGPVVLVLTGVEHAGHAFSNFVAFLETRQTRQPVLVVRLASEVTAAHDGADVGADAFEGRTHPELVAAQLERGGKGDEAAGYYARAGHASLQRGDMPAAADLLSRAARLRSPGSRDRLTALVSSCDALLAIGRADRVVEVARSGLEEAQAAGDDCMSARFDTWVTLMGPPSHKPLAESLDEAARALARCDDPVGRAQVAEASAQLLWDEGDTAGSISAMHEALTHARAGDDRPVTSRIVVWLLDHALAGPSPVPETLALRKQLDWVAEWSALVDVKRLVVGAAAAAAAGETHGARAALDDATSLQRHLGQPGWVARVPQIGAWIDLLQDDAPGAEERVGGIFAELAGVGHPVAVETGVLLARALVRLGRHDESAHVAAECERIASTPEAADRRGEVEAVRASALARSGSRSLDLEAIAARLPSARLPLRRCDALLDLADAAATLGEIDLAGRLSNETIALYEAKGAVACEGRARKALAVYLRQV